MCRYKSIFRAVGIAAVTAVLFAGCGGNGDNPAGGGNNNGNGDNPGSKDNPSITKGAFTDSRDGKTYGKVTIGGQTWMAENLNYAGEAGSEIGVCYKESADSCAKYGRLYDWAAAMGIDASYNSVSYSASDKHQGICGKGWHVPSDAEWTALTDFAGDLVEANQKLRSKTGWIDMISGEDDNGTDDFGFKALPGGFGVTTGGFSFMLSGNTGYWWSATESSAGTAWNRIMGGIAVTPFRDHSKSIMYSVRCVQD